MAVSVKMGVDVSQFKAGMQQAQQSAKTLQTQLKASEAQFKATGDKEQYLANQSKLLKQELEAQKTAAKNAEQALKAMRDNGVSETSKEYQQMQRALAGANAAMYETQAAINGLSASETKAAGGASELEKNLSSIGKNVSLGNIVTGLDKIAGGLESAAKKAVNLGKTIFDEVKNAAKWADDTKTLAEIYEIPVDTLLRMQKLEALGLDTTVENMLGAIDKMSTSLGKDSAAANEALQTLGLLTQVTDAFGNSWNKMASNDPQEMFWLAGEAIKNMPAGFDKNATAMALFGKSWRDVMALFDAYGSLEEYQAALNGLEVTGEDTVDTLAELDDRLKAVETAWNDTKLELLKALAPALQDAATALAELLNRVTQYLKSDEGQEKLKKMEEAVSKLFGDLKNIDPEDVVNKFAGVLEKVVNSFTWVADHWEDVKTGLAAIGTAFGLIKIASFAANLKKVVDGFKVLWGGANKPLPQIPGTDDGAPTTTGGDSGAPKPTAKTPKGKTPTAGPTANPTNFVPFDVTTGATGALGASSSYAMIPGLSGIGEGALGFGNLSLVGAAGGTAILTGIIIAGTKAIRDINEEADKAREVEADMYRFSGGIGGPMGDKRLILQDTVRRLFATSGETGGIMSAQNQMKWLSYNLNNQIMDAFNYTNTSGQSRNKLIDMLNMDPQNAAAAYQMLRWAGFDRPGSDWSKEWRDAYETGKGSYMQIKDSGGNLGYEWALMTIRDYFGKSGVFNENGEWTIPGLEEEMAAQREAAQAMNGAAETMAGLPEQVAAAVSSAPIKVEFNIGGLPKANGIWSVPWDGYPAILHKGERVVPAREASRSYNSNLYVESMYMNNGTDAAGLAAAMAAAQRRTMSGYGS